MLDSVSICVDDIRCGVGHPVPCEMCAKSSIEIL